MYYSDEEKAKLVELMPASTPGASSSKLQQTRIKRKSNQVANRKWLKNVLT